MAHVAKRQSCGMRKLIAFTLIAVVAAALFAAYTRHPAPNSYKNIIVMIGDGMGPAHVGLLESYARFAPNSIYQGQSTALNRLAQQSHSYLSLTSAHQSLVVDSACSATQLATGVPCRSEMIGLDIHGNAVETVAELAQRQGKVVGLVSDTRITHATPAAFGAHQAHRSMESAIAQDLINNRFELLLSGGLGFFIPHNTDLLNDNLRNQIQQAGLPISSKRQDDTNLLEQALASGYQLALSKNQLAEMTSLPVLGLFQNSVMPDAISEQQNSQRNYPSLKEMTDKALQLLGEHPQGFFLMVEVGQIDWAAHNNDAGGLLHEMLKLDEVLSTVLSWVQSRQDTLIVLTADHETGGFGFSYHDANLPGSAQAFKTDHNFVHPEVLDKLYQQSKGSYFILQDIMANPETDQAALLQNEVRTHLGLELTKTQAQAVLAAEFNDYDDFFVYREEKPLNKLAAITASERGIVWSTGTHTAMPVPVFIMGPKEQPESLKGLLTHTQLGQYLKSLLD